MDAVPDCVIVVAEQFNIPLHNVSCQSPIHAREVLSYESVGNIVLSTGDDLRTIVLVGERETVTKLDVADSIPSSRERCHELEVNEAAHWPTGRSLTAGRTPPRRQSSSTTCFHLRRYPELFASY